MRSGGTKTEIGNSRYLATVTVVRNSQLRAIPGTKRFLHQLENCPPILSNHLHPCKATHHREINPAKTETRNENVDAKTQRFVVWHEIASHTIVRIVEHNSHNASFVFSSNV